MCDLYIYSNQNILLNGNLEVQLSDYIRIKGLFWETKDPLKTEEKLLADNFYENIQSNIKLSPSHDQEKRGIYNFYIVIGKKLLDFFKRLNLKLCY